MYFYWLNLKVFLFFLVLPSILFSMDYERFPTAYVEEKGDIFISTTYWRHDTSHFFNKEGKRRKAYNDFTFEEWNLFLAYGLTSSDTLSFQTAWARENESLDGRTFGFEEIELGLKHCFGKKGCYLFSGELLAIIPAETEYVPGLRYGQFGFEVDLLASTRSRIYSLTTQTDFRIGYRYYDGFPSDQIRGDYTFSIFPLSCLKIAGNLHLEYGLFNGKEKRTSSLFRVNANYRLLQGEVRATLSLTQKILLTAGYHYNFWGENIATDGGIILEAALNF